MESEASSNASQIVGSNTDNLYGVIDRDNVHGLNLTVPEDAKETIKPWDERETTEKFAESNVDDQLVIHIPFAENVRIKSVLLKLGRGEVTPRRLRVYANRATIIDFSEADDVQPSLNISLLEGETGVTEYPLRMAAFSSINSLSLFFSNSVGGDSSRIYYIGFKGETRVVRKEGSNKLEIPAANAADAPLTDRVQERAAAQQPTAK
ncbi:galactose-binding domain-like protein [Russula ochroleuca]|uniref:Galactose-binding domain-like protein n=1 Tax=Russula ochroleuca TaxID=152965 RepID=A0A9P5K2E4_9AGAM|nr:galactose-binding domain-like protein [Russula ochroleuca]